VQEQSRPCLPVYTPSLYPSRRAEVYPQQPGLVISALRPTVPLHRDAGRSSNSSSGGDLRAEKETWRPGERRYCISLHVEICALTTGIKKVFGCRWVTTEKKQMNE